MHLGYLITVLVSKGVDTTRIWNDSSQDASRIWGTVETVPIYLNRLLQNLEGSMFVLA